MTEQQRPSPARRRILVALREGRSARAAIQAAAELAAELSAELVGLYVEDEQLVQAATLPVTSLISLHGDTIEPVDASIMRRSMRVQARRLESELAEIAKALNLVWSFARRRGRVIDEILQTALPEDILALEALPAEAPALLTKEITRRASCSLFLVSQRKPSARSVCVVTSASAPALMLGASLSRRTRRTLVVQPVLLGDAPSAPITGQIDQVIGEGSKLPVTVLDPIEGKAEAVISQLSRLVPGHLVINRKCLNDLKLDASDLTRSLQLETVIVTEDEPETV